MRSVLNSFAAGSGALAIMVALTVPPKAQQTEPRGMGACRVDVATFCQGIEAGKGKRLGCLIANEAKLQPACAAIVKERAALRDDRKVASKGGPDVAPSQPAAPPSGQATAVAPGVPADGARPLAACRAERQSLCGNVAAGGGARVRCLEENAAKLSPACAEGLAAFTAAAKERRSILQAACKDDARQFCADQKGGARLQCLAANRAKLSSACSAVVK